ncbi:WD repeat protein [Phlyctema vagabunda]|uniref:WD repeat protein n=1 Tax=Phlyctema vagabunda TaxID=108571 RepID=A0ABR4PP69_9HELO
MASLLKRKGGPAEVLDSPKRVKSVVATKTVPAKFPVAETGWDAAFKPPTNQELSKVNGVNGHALSSESDESASEAEDFDDVMDKAKSKKDGKAAARLARKNTAGWNISEPIAGRMIGVDPVFTEDEQNLIVANRTSLHVYSTTDSLLTRTITLRIDFAARPTARIITYCLSPTLSNLVWVACSDGAIYCVDWTNGSGADQCWFVSSTGCIHMTVSSMISAGRRRDVVFTTEVGKGKGWRVTANELAPPNGPIATSSRTIYTSSERIDFLKTAQEGAVMVASSEKRLIIGSLRSTEYDTIDKIRYEFRVVASPHLISSIDVRVSERSIDEQRRFTAKHAKKAPVVDVLVGDVEGCIFIHNDLLANLIQSQNGNTPGISLVPRKLHWHRQAVYSVKWSLDGNYIISGGTETVLVLWQIDTGKQQMLPHMSATIESIVVSPTGTAYGIRLADNSAMVISTAELKPTANIAGIQAPVIEYEVPITSRVKRVEDEAWGSPLIQRTPAAVNPHEPSQLLLGVGQMQYVKPVDTPVISAPFLQSFNLASGRHVSRQAFARTNVTAVNIAPGAHKISEPRITHIQISSNGEWLATVDEWLPPARDLQHLGQKGTDLKAERERRRESFLKFWQWNNSTSSWELVSRIDAPHALAAEGQGAGQVLDLAADPYSSRFATIGQDGVVRTWSPKTRKRDGVVVRSKDGAALRNWTCQHATSLGKPELEDPSIHSSTGSVVFSEDGSLLAAAYGNSRTNLLHLIDAEIGSIRLSRNDLFNGDILHVGLLGQDLITLSDNIIVYDLVADEIRYNIKFSDTLTSLSTEQKVEMVHFAVDRKASTFAVALPATSDDPVEIKSFAKPSLVSRFSEVAVFSQKQPTPVFTETCSTLVTSLLPAIGTEGYLVLDAGAEIRTITPKGKQVVTALAQSTSALQLDKEDTVESALQVVQENDDDDEDFEVSEPVNEDDDEEEEDVKVITQQQLSEIFDIGPAFALPPLEDMFYQVAGLFASKPITQGA